MLDMQGFEQTCLYIVSPEINPDVICLNHQIAFASEKLIFHPVKDPDSDPLYFPVRKRQLLVGPDFTYLPGIELELIYIGTLEERDCYCAELPDDFEAPQNMQYCGLRELYAVLDMEMLGIASRAVQMADHFRINRYCGVCAGKTEYVPEETGMRCVECEHIAYPRISPAIIVLIFKGDRVLMAQGIRAPEGRYGLIAGFVEPGETLEHAVHREVLEEVGVRIKEPGYFGSQPWPFPSSLMIGFTAEYESGEIAIDPVEIKDAKWFDIDNLPGLPGKLSISAALIQNFINSRNIK